MNELEKMKIFKQKGWTYDEKTGEIFNTRGSLSKVKGKLGYLQILTSINKQIIQVYSHRFAWFYYYGVLPKLTIDHINKNKEDNRIINLRDVSHRENCLNSRGKFGKGYQHYITVKGEDRFRVAIRKGGKITYLGTFKTEIEARNKYLEEKLKLLIEN